MIHKFDRADANLSTRENVFILVDEAHRTTTGDLGNYLVGALPDATMIGFTGTPIDRTAYGRGTFEVFGKEDPPGYAQATRETPHRVCAGVQASREREETGFDLNSFTIYWVLKRAGASQAEKIAPLLAAVLRRFPSYSYSAGQRRQLKAELYKLLLPAVGKERMVELAEQILRLQRK